MEPQRGVAFLPKRGVNMHDNEVMRAYRTVNDTYIEPVSFIVPRRSEVFQSDIYPPTVGLKSAMSSGDYFGGKNGLPPKIDLESVYEGEGLKEVPADYKPMPQPAPGPVPEPTAPETKKATEPVREEPPPIARGPPPSMKDQSQSISAMASKFADKDDEPEEDDDTSSFEEVAKPAERPKELQPSTAKVDEPMMSPPHLWKSQPPQGSIAAAIAPSEPAPVSRPRDPSPVKVSLSLSSC